MGHPFLLRSWSWSLLMSFPQSYKFTFLKLLESIDPKKLTWEVIVIRLLNEELTRKEKFGFSKSISKYAFMLIQRKLESKNNKDKNNVVEISDEINVEAFIFSLPTPLRSMVWYVNSNVSTHLSHEQKWFKDY